MGWLLSSPYLLHRDSGSSAVAAYLIVAGTAFALGAGATPLWRSTVDGLAAHTAAGLALIVLAATALSAPVMLEEAQGASWGQVTPVPIPALGLLCAILIGVLFAAQRGDAQR